MRFFISPSRLAKISMTENKKFYIKSTAGRANKFARPAVHSQSFLLFIFHLCLVFCQIPVRIINGIVTGAIVPTIYFLNSLPPSYRPVIMNLCKSAATAERTPVYPRYVFFAVFTEFQVPLMFFRIPLILLWLNLQP